MRGNASFTPRSSRRCTASGAPAAMPSTSNASATERVIAHAVSSVEASG
ncbi:MAG: hypothetical protein U1F49_00700 [Rubrivivax sp.]